MANEHDSEDSAGRASESDQNSGGLFQMRYREVTVSALLLALLIGVVMNAAITYSGLKIGFTITGSAIAAVLGFGILRGVLRKGSILETNVVQTAASGVNTAPGENSGGANGALGATGGLGWEGDEAL